MIFRTPKRRDYFALSNALAEDESLSYEMLGIMTYLLSKPDNWILQPEDLAKRGKISKNKVYKLIKLLIKAGYLARTTERGEKGRYTDVIYDIHEKPHPITENREMEKREMDNQDAENPQIENDDVSKYLEIVSTESPDANASDPAPAVTEPKKAKRTPKPKPEKTAEEIEKARVKHAIDGMLEAWHDGHEAVGTPPYSNSGYRKVARELLEAGITAEDVKAFVTHKRAEQWHKDNGVSWNKIKNGIREYLKHHSPAVASANGASSNWMREL